MFAMNNAAESMGYANYTKCDRGCELRPTYQTAI